MESERLISGEPSDNWYRVPHTKDNQGINFEAKWILQCLVRGISGSGSLSKISIKKICSWCSYTDIDGKYHPYGKDRLNSVLHQLEEAGKIKINHPKQGGCTTYTINGLNSFEPVPDTIYYLQLSPEQKGFILYMLENNANNYRKSHGMSYDPNIAECDYHEQQILDTSHYESMNQFRKIENSLIPYGVYSITETSKRHKDSGTIVISRKLDLRKLGLIGFTLQSETTTRKQIDDLYDTIDNIDQRMLTKDDLDTIVNAVVSRLNNK